MNTLAVVLAVLVTAVLIRQVFVLGAVVRSARFLRHRLVTPPAGAVTTSSDPVFFIIVPVLRETAIIAEAVAHFEALAQEDAATLVIVTTASEAAGASHHQGNRDTITLVNELAKDGKFVHLHYPHPAGLKADQLNFAVAYCASTLPSGVPLSHAFVVCYAVESDRNACARSQPNDVVLMDRSVYTLLAHRYSLERITRLKLSLPARTILAKSDTPAWPDLVLYLDLPQEAIPYRNNGKFDTGNVFIDPHYNAGVRSFFEALADSDQPSLLWMDAMLGPAELQDTAEIQIRKLLADGDNGHR